MTATISAPSPYNETIGSPARRREHRRGTTARLLQQAFHAADSLERERLLEDVICLNMEVAESIAARYRRRGVPDEDLTQVAYVGLVKAVRGFDPSFERDFLAFAVPTIRGEVKRHFRDRGWTVRPPRRLQELQQRIGAARETMGHELGRSPRPTEVAGFLGVKVEDVIEALACQGCFAPTSLDRPTGEDGTGALADTLAREDGGVPGVEARHILASVSAVLSDRDRRILYLRFFEQRTQHEIADEIGVTQMQVSRLLSRILADLRKAVGT